LLSHSRLGHINAERKLTNHRHEDGTVIGEDDICTYIEDQFAVGQQPANVYHLEENPETANRWALTRRSVKLIELPPQQLSLTYSIARQAWRLWEVWPIAASAVCALGVCLISEWLLHFLPASTNIPGHALPGAEGVFKPCRGVCGYQ
jgi:hypothetical protein